MSFILFIAVVVLSVTVFLLNKKIGEYRSSEEHIKELYHRLEDKLKEAESYKSKVINIDKYKDDAEKEAENMLSSAKNKIDEANHYYETKVKEADKYYETKLNESKQYEKATVALKNIVDGYGNTYLVPSHSILDDLADEFGFEEAGAQLKIARTHTRELIKASKAASCEYVQQDRRDTAIDFVVDAFNGKVDSILSTVKHDNYGTLQQKIKDAFALVNLNGKAFRGANITAEFLAARLNELLWACRVMELKLKEKEEQRRIKEQLREEEKARREYERAIRESAKEEETIRKAMERAQEQIDKSSAEQREKYEAQLAELEQKLKAAEEKNQRAISMAQMTKRGFVYIISNIGSLGDDVHKIGLTRRLEPYDRIRELGDASVPFEFDVHAMIFSEDAPALESQLHKHFVLQQVNKVNPRKEFFRASIQDIKAEIESLGIEAHWTITAEAKQYRETLAIESAIKSSPDARDAWVRGQLSLEDHFAFEDEESGELVASAAN